MMWRIIIFTISFTAFILPITGKLISDVDLNIDKTDWKDPHDVLNDYPFISGNSPPNTDLSLHETNCREALKEYEEKIKKLRDAYVILEGKKENSVDVLLKHIIRQILRDLEVKVTSKNAIYKKAYVVLSEEKLDVIQRYLKSEKVVEEINLRERVREAFNGFLIADNSYDETSWGSIFHRVLPYLLIANCILLIPALLIIIKSVLSRKQLIWFAFSSCFCTSYYFTYRRKYQEVLARRIYTMQKNSANVCEPANFVGQAFNALLGLVRIKDKDECLRKFEDHLIEPLYELNLLDIAAEVLTSFILTPLKGIGYHTNIFFNEFFRDTPLWLTTIKLGFLLVVVILIFFSVSNYRIRTILATFEPAVKQETTPKVIVKWRKEKFELDADQNETPLLFKSQLFKLTGVPPERQKVIIKEETLSDESWNGISLSSGTTIRMMSSSEALPEKPVDNKKGGATAGEEGALILPVGMKNLGNTGYMSATLQCLRTIPELEEALKHYNVQTANLIPSKLITACVKDLYNDLRVLQEQNKDSVIPLAMVNMLHNVFPQFATRTEQGTFQQQDANECWTEILHMLSNEVDYKPPNADRSIKIGKLLEGRFAVTLRNLEDPNEPPTSSNETFMQLSCFPQQEIKYMQLGIKSRLVEEIEKHSEKLERNAKYEKKCLIERLPAYLSIQMVRFYYKKKFAMNSKILNDIKFPINLDLFEMCTPDLQTKLLPMREKFKEYEDKKIEIMRQIKLGEAEAPKPKVKVEYEPSGFPDDVGSNNSGFYELQAVLTHKGRSSNSGHYVAWVRLKDNKWAMLDDDTVLPVDEDDVLKLSGGGDWHCAYVLLYGPKYLKNM